MTCLIEMAQTEGYVSEGDNYVTVVLDTNLTPELLEEGFVREIVSKIQTMRKEAGFEVMDHITVSQDNNDKIADIFKKYADELKARYLPITLCLDRWADTQKSGISTVRTECWVLKKQQMTAAEIAHQACSRRKGPFRQTVTHEGDSME